MSHKGYAVVQKDVVLKAIANYDTIGEQLLQKRMDGIKAIELTWWEKFTGVTKKEKYFDGYGWWCDDDYGVHTCDMVYRNNLETLVCVSSTDTIAVDQRLSSFISEFKSEYKEDNNVE